MNKENKLGMGLGALLSTTNNNSDSSNGIQKINISQIIPNPSQPRKNFKDEDLKELSSSIKNQGLIQPIIIKPIKDGQYQIIAGERRWRACQLNGMHEVECVIKNLDDTNVLEAALIENIQREDLNVIENKLTNTPLGKDDYKFREINFTYPSWKPNEKIRIDKKVEDIQKEYQELGQWELPNKQRFKYDA